eukprot:3703273-Alexandrium_andersonii.AAC.1
MEANDPWAAVDDSTWVDNGIAHELSAFQVCAALEGAAAAWINLPPSAQAETLAAALDWRGRLDLHLL